MAILRQIAALCETATRENRRRPAPGVRNDFIPLLRNSARYDVIRPTHVRLRTIAGSNHAAPVSILALPCFRYRVFRNTDCASADITVLAAASGAIHHSAGSRFGRRHYGSFARRQACREMGPA